MLARIHSYHFAVSILNSTIRLFDPLLKEVAVPAAVLVRTFIKEALKESPKTEEELVAYYIDENKILRTSGKGGVPGKTEDISALLDEKFEPEDPKEKELTQYSGRIIGRKII